MTEIEQAEQNLSNISRELPCRFIIRKGKILKNLKSVCSFIGVDYLG